MSPGSSPLTTSSQIACSHGGQVLARPSRPGATGLTPSDSFSVAGCPLPRPCVRVQWFGSPTQPLDVRSSGICLNAAGTPQGPAVIVRP